MTVNRSHRHFGVQQLFSQDRHNQGENLGFLTMRSTRYLTFQWPNKLLALQKSGVERASATNKRDTTKEKTLMTYQDKQDRTRRQTGTPKPRPRHKKSKTDQTQTTNRLKPNRTERKRPDRPKTTKNQNQNTPKENTQTTHNHPTDKDTKPKYRPRQPKDLPKRTPRDRSKRRRPQFKSWLS